MSCGTKITGRFDSYSERDELSRHLERDGEFSLAHKVRHGDCLDSYDLRRAENALGRQGLSNRHDYREHDCHCSTEDEGL